MAEKEISVDLGSIFKKIKDNKKLVVYGVLFLILALSAYIRIVPESGDYLSGGDPFWFYRWAKNIVSNGHPGEEVRDGVSWTNLRAAPDGGPSLHEPYSYFAAYSYKYFAKLFFPNFLSWMRYTSPILGLACVLLIFLLGRQLFNEKAGLAAAFIYSLSPAILTRTTLGFADNDAIVAFATLLSMLLFVMAWDKKSILYSISCSASILFFAFAWGGYWFFPMLMIGATGAFLLAKLAIAYLGKKDLKSAVLENKRQYLLVAGSVVLGLSLAAIFYGSINHLLIWRNILGFTQIKSLPAIGACPNVMLTVAEMNPGSVSIILQNLHLGPIILFLSFFGLLFYGLWKKLLGKLYHLVFIAVWLAATFYSSLTAVRFIEMLVIPFAIVVGVAVSEFLERMDTKKPIIFGLIGVFLVASVFAVPQTTHGGPSFVKQSYYIAQQSSFTQSTNWGGLFAWMRDETPKGSVMASWWDPGHEVAAIGERPVVADGSQDPCRVHDLALAFTSRNETEAYELLKKYNVTYFFTSSDLIPKFGAISFLSGRYKDASGNPTALGYPIISLSQQPTQLTDATMLTYKLNDAASVIITIKQDAISAVLKQGYQSSRIRSLYYIINNTGVLQEQGNETNSIDALLFINPGFQQVVLLNGDLKDNLLTRLHFFGGAGLERFRAVKNFGGEIKVYELV